MGISELKKEANLIHPVGFYILAMNLFKNMKNSLFIVLLSLVVVLTSCAQPVCKCYSQKCYFPDARTTQAPSWLCEDKIPGYKFIAIGYADKSPAGISLMRRQAVSMARRNLMQKLDDFNSNVRKEVKSGLRSKSGSLVDMKLTDMDIDKAKIIKVTASPTQRMYVLVGVK